MVPPYVPFFSLPSTGYEIIFFEWKVKSILDSIFLGQKVDPWFSEEQKFSFCPVPCLPHLV